MSVRCIVLLTVLMIGVGLHAAYAAEGGPAVVGENLVTNGGFEEGEQGWRPAPQLVEGEAYEGERYGVIDNTADESANLIVQSFVPLKPATYYEFRMAAKRETGEGYFYVHCNWYAAPGKRLMSSPQWHAGRAEPVTLRTGEGTGDWGEYSMVFRSNRADMGGVQIVMFIRDGKDRVSVDDISIREVQYPEAPEWTLPDAVIFDGHPSRFGMAVEGAEQDGQRFTVTTSGARYVLDAAAGTMDCSQRIGGERDVVRADFGGPLGELRFAQRDAEVCVLEGKDLALGFQGDSLVTIATNRPLTATLTSAIGALWFRTAEPHLLAIDEQGGWCVTPWSRPELSSPGTSMTRRGTWGRASCSRWRSSPGARSAGRSRSKSGSSAQPSTVRVATKSLTRRFASTRSTPACTCCSTGYTTRRRRASPSRLRTTSAVRTGCGLSSASGTNWGWRPSRTALRPPMRRWACR